MFYTDSIEGTQLPLRLLILPHVRYKTHKMYRLPFHSSPGKLLISSVVVYFASDSHRLTLVMNFITLT